jgi:predicted GNAT family acetyltransferase
MNENKIKLKWERITKYDKTVFPKIRTPRGFDLTISGDPELDAESKCVANMGVWLDCGVIYHLYVQPKWRNKGIGKRMLKEAERKIKKMNKTSIGILVDRLNSQAISFYEKRGYHMTDEIMITFNIMRKEQKAKCPIPCEVSWKTNGEACFDKRCPKASLE